MVWNSVDRATRGLDKLDSLKATLKRNKTSLCLLSYNRGTTVNSDKDIDFLHY